MTEKPIMFDGLGYLKRSKNLYLLRGDKKRVAQIDREIEEIIDRIKI